MSGLRRLLAALRRALPSPSPGSGYAGRPPAARPPRTSVRTGPSVPALVLRAVLLALCLSVGAVLGVGLEQWWVSVVVGVVLTVRPHAALLALGAAVLIGIFALVGEHWWQLPVVVLVTHALLRVGAVADAVSWRGHVELAVLRDALPAFLAVQAVAQVAVGLALVLDGAAPVPWLVVGGVGALGILSWVVVTAIRAAR